MRRYVDNVRYADAEPVSWLTALYATLHRYTNFFQPLQKVVAKERRGARTDRRYDRAQTPYQRVMVLPDTGLSPDRKAASQAQDEALNPAPPASPKPLVGHGSDRRSDPLGGARVMISMTFYFEARRHALIQVAVRPDPPPYPSRRSLTKVAHRL